MPYIMMQFGLHRSELYHIQTVNDYGCNCKTLNSKLEENTDQCIHVKFKRLWHRRSTNQPNKRHTQRQKQQKRLISVFVLN